MDKRTCPFCGGEMRRKATEEVIDLLAPSGGTVSVMLKSGAKKTRGSWYECGCGFIALFMKAPTEG